MLRLALESPERRLRSMLMLGAHADDIEIGCGGTVLQLLTSHPDVVVNWVVLSAHGDRAREAQRGAATFAAGAQRRQVVVKDFRDGFFPYVGAEIKEFFEELKGQLEPDIIFTHRREDLHQDHRLVGELTWNTFRDHLILEYEIPKFEGDLGAPNLFVHLSKDTSRQKVAALRQSFPTQAEKRWFTDDTFWSLLRLRGLESNAPSKFAEGFYCRKLVLRPDTLLDVPTHDAP